MKTATVTWITYNNYGTELQAYALQQYQKEQGIQNDIISDWYIIYKTKDVQESCTTTNENAIAKQLKRVQKYAFHPVRFSKAFLQYCNRKVGKLRCYVNSQSAFEAFKDEYLQILYGLRREDMVLLNQKYDAFICGSDQTWSVFDRNFDGYFYLDFADKKKIAYAASIGTDQIDQEHGEQIAELLKDFSDIAVREKRTAEQLSLLTGRNVEWAVDPTLLYDKYFWSDFCVNAKVPKKKYLLCYFLTDNPWYYDYASALAAHLHLQILLIPSSEACMRRKGAYCKTVGPVEFVSLFKNAEYVLTDSYHGSIFSMIFEKQFIYLKRFKDTDPICQNIRIVSLFEKVDLMSRIVDQRAFEPSDVIPIDYNKVNEIVTAFREQSRQYLQNALSKV